MTFLAALLSLFRGETVSYCKDDADLLVPEISDASSRQQNDSIVMCQGQRTVSFT